MVEIIESDIQNNQRDILRIFREISKDRFEADENATKQIEVEINDADGLIIDVAQDVEKQINQHQEKTDELSHIHKADKWLIISISTYLLIFIQNEYSIIVSQIISSVGLSRAVSAWNMSEYIPSADDKWEYLWLMFIPFLPLLLAIYYRLISYPKGLKTISERYPYAIDEEEAGLLLDEGEGGYNALVNAIENDFKDEISEICSTYECLFKELEKVNHINTEDYGLIGASWENEIWKNWEPVDEVIPFIRIGDFVESGIYDVLSMPAILPVIGGRNIMFKVSKSAERSEVQAIQSIMLRMLSFVPPGKLQFVLIDPLYSHELADFLCLNKHNQTLTGSQVWTEPRDIERELSHINKRMEFINQNIIPKYGTFENYYAESNAIVEPYRVLVVIDYPSNFNDDSIRYLNNIARIGSRCGIHTIITVDTLELHKDNWSNINLADIEDSSNKIVLDSGNGTFFLDEEDFKECHLNLDDPSSQKLFNFILEKVGSQASENDKVGVQFNETLSKYKEQFWKGSSESEIQAPIGLTQTGELQNFKLDDASPHGIVIGQTGKGKSYLFHVLINALGFIYSPNELQLYLIDLKKGVGFKPYATHEMPHARVVSINSERKFGLSVLKRLSVEMEKRSVLLKEADAGSFAAYRAKVRPPIPRILLLVDEFQKLFERHDSIAGDASKFLKELVTQGRGFGIHVLLGSQSLAGDNNPGQDIVGQMAVRIALSCLPADSNLILAEDNDAAAYLSRRGEAIYNNENGFKSGNKNFQVSWLPDEEIVSNLEEISKKVNEKNYVPPKPQIVFDGNALAELRDNQRLNNLITDYPNITPSNKVPVWLGEPIDIKDPTTACFNNDGTNNLIVAGNNESTAAGILLSSLIALGFQYKQKEVDFSFINLGSIDTPHFNHFNSLSDFIPHPVELVEHDDLPDFFHTIAENITQRQNMGHQSKKAHYIVIFGLHKLRNLKEDDLYDAESPTKRFATILEQGPNVGVHTLVWCDSYNKLISKIGSDLIDQFDLRIALQMSEEISIRLINLPNANQLGDNEAIYYSENGGDFENFKPYNLPSKDWLTWVNEQIKSIGINFKMRKGENVDHIKKVDKSQELSDNTREDTFEPKMVCPKDGKITLGLLRIKNSTPFLYCEQCGENVEINTNKFVFDTNVLVDRLFSDLLYSGFFDSKTIMVPETVIDEINNWKNIDKKTTIYNAAHGEVKKLIRYNNQKDGFFYKVIGKEANYLELIEKHQLDKIIIKDAIKENAFIITGDTHFTTLNPDASVVLYKYSPPSVNEKIKIKIIGESHGDWVGHYKNYTIFIKGGNEMIDEIVLVEIVNVIPDKNHAIGKIIEKFN